MPRGTIKATVLIETILAAFEMDEILYELREHSAGLNAGRWDYIFSVIKKLGHRPEFVLPDRAAVTMAVPFMRAYSELLVKTCHRRGAHAIGGMAAFIPSRRDPAVNEIALAKVREDKEREAGQGFDGTWVAHPDLVPVAMEIFDRVLGERPNQVERQRDDVTASADALLDVASTPGEITEEGLRNNVSVGIQYLAAWLQGSGAVAIFNLMEDAATSEISRSQVWQWLAHGKVERADVERVLDEEVAKLDGDYAEARALFEQVALGRGVRRVPDAARVRAHRLKRHAGRVRSALGGDEPGQQLAAAVAAGLLEDRLEVILDGVRGDEKPFGDGSGIASADEQADHLPLPRRERAGAAEEIEGLARSGSPDGDRNLRVAVTVERSRFDCQPSAVNRLQERVARAAVPRRASVAAG